MKLNLKVIEKKPVIESGDVVVINKRGNLREYQIIFLGHGEYGAVNLDMMRVFTKADSKSELLEKLLRGRQDYQLVEIIKSKDLELRRVTQ